MRKIFSIFAAVLFAGSMMADNFALVTDASTLAAGDEIIITNAGVTVAISTTQNNNNRAAAAVALSDGVIVPGADVQIITLEAAGTNFMLQVGDNAYLYAASNSSNHLKTSTAATAGDNGKFAITIGADGVASIVAQGTSARNVMQYNAQSNLFACYGSATQTALKIFKKEAGDAPSGDVEPVVLPATLDVTNVSFRSEDMPDFVLEEGDYAGTYFDMGAHDSATDTLLYAEWDVTIEPIKYNIAVDVYNTNSWCVQLYLLNQAGDTVKSLRYKGSFGQCGQFGIGSMDMTDLEAGNYKLRAHAATAWSAMKLKDIIFAADYQGATVDLPGTLLPAYAELSNGASATAEAIAFAPSTANNEYATWNVNFAQAGNFDVTIAITASNGHNYGVALLSADGATEIGAVNEGAQNNDTGVKELGAIAVPEAGAYKVKLTNSIQWSEAVLNSITFTEVITIPQYEVATAIAAGLTNGTEIEVRGVVTKMEMKGKNFAKYGSVNIYVADATGAAGQFEFYNCYSMNADTFKTTNPAYDATSSTLVEITEVSDANGFTIHVGDTVVGHGKYQLYNSTHELNTGCYIVYAKVPTTAPVEENCNWDEIAFLGNGSGNAAYTDRFKICAGDPAPTDIVNIQSSFGTEPGIYVTFPSAAFGDISLEEDQYAIQGAGMLLYVSAFLYDAETEVTIVCQEVTYTLTVKNVNPETASVEPITCFDVYQMAKNDVVDLLNDVTVTYANGKNVWVRDGSASMLIYFSANTTYAPGDVLSGVAGVVDIYNGVYEIKPSADQAAAIVATPGEVPAAIQTVVVETADMNKYIVMPGIQFEADAAFVEGTASNITMNGVVVRNNFKNGYAFEAGKKYNVYGVVTIYQNNPQVYFITAEELDTTGFDNAASELKAVKVIENGQLFIIKNGVRYDAQGTVVR